MEKLEPILKQKFWILLGVGILMTITGWWLATGSLAATITTRKGEVEKAFTRIPSGEIPNTDWSTQLAARNVLQEQAVKNTALNLWERQKSQMVWPESVAKFAWQNGYRGDIQLGARESYRTDYGRDVRRVWESVQPFKQFDGSGIVAFGQDQRALPQTTFGRLAPSAAEMWDAQEDLWLLEALLKGIVSVNGGPTGERSDAYVHVISKLELCGGVPAAQRKSSGGGGATGSAGGAAGAHGGAGAPSMMGNFGSGGSSDGGPGGRPGGQAAVTSADFDRREEFGEDGSNKLGQTGAMGSGGSAMPTGPAGGHAGGGMTSGGAAPSAARRYIEDDAALPYKTRGFYLSVYMDHRKIPNLIAELSANEGSAWPVEIVRVQMVRLHDDDVMANSTGGMASSGGGRPAILGLNSLGGGGQMGFPSSSSDGSEGFGRTPMPMDVLRDSNDPNTIQSAAAGMAQLDAALQDPFMAHVALCGFITLYKEVKPEPVAAVQPGQPLPPAQPGQPVQGPGAATPAEGAGQAPAEGTNAAPDESSNQTPANSTDPAATAPATTDQTPADQKPAVGEKGNEEPPADKNPAEPGKAPGTETEPGDVPTEPSPNQ